MATDTQTIQPLPLTSEPTTQSSPPSTAVSAPHDSTFIPRGPVTSPLNYYSAPEDGSVPYNVIDPAPGVKGTNFGSVAVDTKIQDIRGHEASFSLDTNSFLALSNVSSEEHDFEDDEHIKSVYYPEVEKSLLDNIPGSNRVLLFDHTIRRDRPGASRTPVTRTHIDQTPYSAKLRVYQHLPKEEADEVINKNIRYRIINVWRPLNGPVQSFPLGFADSVTVKDEDLVAVEHRYTDRTGETAAVQYSKDMRWHYWSGMTNDERLLLQCYDSQNASARLPHTAFVDPRTPEGAAKRESIEVRALVFG